MSMGAGGISLREWVNDRFNNMDTRIRSVHDRQRKLEDDIHKKGEVDVRLESRLDDLSNDMKELKEDMKWIKRGLFGGIAVGLAFTVALASLVTQIAS
jgi:hypothetical protein